MIWLPFGIVLAHLCGDYLFQSHWMALGKTERFWPAFWHAITYTLPYAALLFLIPGLINYSAPDSDWLMQAWITLFIIAYTHYWIDRYRLAVPIIWLKNQIAPRKYRVSWAEAQENSGYSAATPVWLSTWLMIITDNFIHIIINSAAILATMLLVR